MADEKIASLSIESSQAEDGLNRVADAAENAGEKLAGAGAAVEKTEKEFKRLANSTREYNTAARMVGDSTQSITKFEQAYRAAIKDTGNAESVKAQILGAAMARTIGGMADEKRALDLLNAGHADAAAAVRMVVAHNAQFRSGLEANGKASRASAYQYQNLSYQLNDVVSGLAMGQRPMQVLAQQGGQLFQIFTQMNSPLRAIGGLLLTTTGAFTATAAAIGAVTYAGISYGNSVKAMDLAVRSSNGMVGLSTTQLQKQAAALADTGEVSEREAGQIQKAFIDAGTVGSVNYGRLVNLMGDTARMMDTDVSAAAETVAKAMADPAKAAVEYNGKLWNLTAGQERNIAELVRAGDVEKAQAALIDALSAKISDVDTKTGLWTRTVNALSNAWKGLGRAANPSTIEEQLKAAEKQLELARQGGKGTYGGYDVSAYGAPNTASIEAEIAKLRAKAERDAANAAAGGATAPGQAAIRLGNVAADKLIPDNQKALQEQASLLLKARDAAKEGTDEYSRLAEAYEAVSNAASTWISEGRREVLLAEARAAASKMTSAEGAKYLSVKTAEINSMGKVISAAERERIAKAASLATTTAYTKAITEQNKAIALAEIDSGAKLAGISLDQERQALAQRRTLGEISAAEEAALAVEIGDRRRAAEEDAASQRLALLRRTAGVERTEIEAAERALTELRAKGRSDRQRELDAEVSARRAQIRQLAELTVQGDASAATSGVDTKAEDLRFGQEMGAVSGVDTIAARERAIADERYQIELKLLQDRLALADQEPVKRREILEQIAALERKHALDLQKLDHQTTTNRLASIRSWTAPIMSAMNGMVQGIFQGTQTARQVIANFGQAVVASYANMAAQAVMRWIEQHILLAAWEAMFGQQSVAQKAATEGQKAAIVAGSEAAQTGAVVAGVGTRTAAETAGNAATKTTAIGKIMVKAGEAAANVYEAVSAIPYVGWILAPIAAGAAFAAVAAFSAFSSAGGERSVPYDNAPYFLHKQETVLPARYSVPLAKALESGVFSTGIPNTALVQAALAREARSLMAIGVNTAFALPFGTSAASLDALGFSPTGLPDFIRERPSFGGSTTTKTTTSPTHIHVSPTFNISAVDGRSVEQLIMDKRGTIADAVFKAARDGHKSASRVVRG